MKGKQFDLIILENRPGFVLQLSQRTKTPVISHIHTDLLYIPTFRNQSIVSATFRFFAVSEYIKKEIMKVGVNCDIRVIYNGLDTNRFHKKEKNAIIRQNLGFQDTDYVAVYWGRLVPKKGIKELLQAMDLLKEHPDIKLLVIYDIQKPGQGAERLVVGGAAGAVVVVEGAGAGRGGVVHAGEADVAPHGNERLAVRIHEFNFLVPAVLNSERVRADCEGGIRAFDRGGGYVRAD